MISVDELLKSLPRRARAKKRPKDARSFYASWAWKALRYRILKERGRRCECCNATAADGVKICVDHIKPLRRFWHLRLDPENTQILCDDCNRGKSNKHTDDWRAPPGPA